MNALDFGIVHVICANDEGSTVAMPIASAAFVARMPVNQFPSDLASKRERENQTGAGIPPFYSQHVVVLRGYALIWPEFFHWPVLVLIWSLTLMPPQLLRLAATASKAACFSECFAATSGNTSAKNE